MSRVHTYIFCALLLLSLTSCKESDLLSMRELSEAVTKGGGWAALPVPDSKLRPGTIIQVIKNDGIRFVGYLGSCNVPEDILKPIPGKVGSVQFNKKVSYDAKALLNIKGIEAGPEFDMIKHTSFRIADFGADAVDLLKLSVWLTDPDNADKIPKLCLDWLAEENIYLVNETFRVSKGMYTVLDNTGAKLSLSYPLLKQVLKVSADAGARWTADGDLEITDPVYIAVRKARKLGNRFETLGQRWLRLVGQKFIKDN